MDSRAAASRFALVLEMCDLGIRIQRQNLSRTHPGASEAEIDRLLAGWLAARPGADWGDGEGRPSGWPRHRAA